MVPEKSADEGCEQRWLSSTLSTLHIKTRFQRRLSIRNVLASHAVRTWELQAALVIILLFMARLVKVPKRHKTREGYSCRA
jgi:hypothetical protein